MLKQGVTHDGDICPAIDHTLHWYPLKIYSDTMRFATRILYSYLSDFIQAVRTREEVLQGVITLDRVHWRGASLHHVGCHCPRVTSAGTLSLGLSTVRRFMAHLTLLLVFFAGHTSTGWETLPGADSAVAHLGCWLDWYCFRLAIGNAESLLQSPNEIGHTFTSRLGTVSELLGCHQLALHLESGAQRLHSIFKSGSFQLTQQVTFLEGSTPQMTGQLDQRLGFRPAIP